MHGSANGFRPHTLARAALMVLAGVAAATAEPEPLAARVDRVFARWDTTRSPGCALGVSQDGRIVYERGFGMANLEHDLAITPDSIFHVASISKQFTAFSVALLASEGKLSLDGDVREHVPELPDLGPRITIRQLMHHTSGLRDQWNLLELAGWREDDLITEGDVLGILSRQKGLNFAPGAEYLYSNSGYTLLAVIVKRVSGQSLREFAQDRIFAPLGMTHTHFHDDHTMIVRNRTSAYKPRPEGGWKISIPVFDTYGATSLFTTTGDLLRWQQNFADARVGSRELLAQMLTPGRLNDGDEVRYGLGVVNGSFRGLPTLGHSGADAGYRADVVRFPDQRLVVTALCNLSNIAPAALTRQVAEVYLESVLGPAHVAPAAAEVAEREIAGWAGLYWSPIANATRRLSVESGTLALGPGGTRLVAIAANRFRVPDQPTQLVFEATGELRVEAEGQKPVLYRRASDARLSRVQLEALVGGYSSDELGADWSLVLANDGLVLKAHKRPDAPLRLLEGDAFQAEDTGILRFTRDRDRKVDGFLVSTGRVRGVRFEKVDATLDAVATLRPDPKPQGRVSRWP